MSRWAACERVFYIEEPEVGPDESHLSLRHEGSGVWVAEPYIQETLTKEAGRAVHIALIQELIEEHQVTDPVAWYYTPMAVDYTRQIQPALTIYDCMDELSAFKGSPPKMLPLEAELFEKCDMVFTGGESLFQAKRQRHANVYCFPSSIDYDHFAQARKPLMEPKDQAGIKRPRLGYYGVIDERMDLELLSGLASERPEWEIIMIGPVVKLDPDRLPQSQNLHYLGKKSYSELPIYLSGWNVALLPFVCNETTRYISPTKTPEYLAGGRPVVATPITDVVHPYGELELVTIASGVPAFIRAVEAVLQPSGPMQPGSQAWLHKVDLYLSQTSWNRTHRAMDKLIRGALKDKLQDQEAPDRACGD